LKMRIATLLTILCLALSVPVFAGTLVYDDGPINGTSNSLFIDGVGGPFGQSISDGFTPVNNFTGNITVTFGEWVASGTHPTGVSYGIGTQNFGGTITAATGFTSTLLCTNGSAYNGGICAGGFGYDVYESSFTASGSFSTGAEAWLTLTGATDSGGTGFNGWDFFNGPATCDFEVGTIVPGGGSSCGFNGEAFTITTAGGTGTTPEPSSILLFGSGILGLAGVLRRKLTR
jgi:hypothetical protein